MAPSTAAATAAPARRHANVPGPGWRRGRGAGTRTAAPDARRAPLRLVPGRTRSGVRTARTPASRGRRLNILSASIVVAALLAVVVGQALLANGQVKMSALQQELSLEQSAHRQAELAVAELETPSRIVGAAVGQQQMVRPAVVDLPYVSLSVPLPTPNVTPAPAPAPATTATSTP